MGNTFCVIHGYQGGAYWLERKKSMPNQIESNTKQPKPLGIILTALYFAIANGLLSLLVSIPLLFMSGLSVPAWATLLGIVSLATGVLSLATCYGIWVLIEWGRKLAITMCALFIPLNLVSLKMPGQETTSGAVALVIVSIAFDVLIIWYLLKDDVKSRFSEASDMGFVVSADRECPHCNAPITNTDTFCPECGAKL
jgi:uncharacterized membrane protein (DUF2068 family)